MSSSEIPLNRLRLGKATFQELRMLKEILDADEQSPSSIFEALERQSHSRMGRWLGGKNTYEEIVEVVARSAISQEPHLPLGPQSTTAELEDRVAEKILLNYRDSLSPESRAELDQHLLAFQRNLSNEKNSLGSVAGGVLAAQLAAQSTGFGVYMLASSVTAGLAHTIGLTLPFAAYTGLSSFVSVLIGPVGIALSGGMLLLNFLKKDLSRAELAIFHLARIRHRTASVLAVSFSDPNPQIWFKLIAGCSNMQEVGELAADLKDSILALGSLPGFWIIYGLSELLQEEPLRFPKRQEDRDATADALMKGFSFVPEVANTYRAIDCAVSHFQRFWPGRTSYFLATLTRSAPSAPAIIYARAPNNSELHHIAILLLVQELLTLVLV